MNGTLAYGKNSIFKINALVYRPYHDNMKMNKK